MTRRPRSGMMPAMELMTAHRILIGTAIVACFLVAAWSLLSPQSSGGPRALSLAAASIVAGAKVYIAFLVFHNSFRKHRR